MPLLTGPQIGKIRDAILDWFTLESFEEFLLVRLDKRLDVIAGNQSNFRKAALVVVQQSSMEGWCDELLKSLRESRPHAADVFVVAVDTGTASLPQDADNLEREIRENRPGAEFGSALQKLASLPYKICHISYPVNGGTVDGTGFLVGPSAVITNRHVMDRVINGSVESTKVKLNFDYYRPAAGVSPTIGTAATLAADDWLIDDSPHDPLDVNKTADADAARSDAALDYALLQLAKPLGDLPIGSGEEAAEKRGWIHLPGAMQMPVVNDVVYIFQHPRGQPLKWALPDVVLGVNENQTRLRYAVNTDNGSSGSPVFDAAISLVALHHAGDPNFEPLHKPEYNQGIPINKIVERLKAGGHDQWLGDESEGGQA